MVGDPRCLQQILLNLVTNAVKFTGAGGTIILNVCLKEMNGRNVLSFEISDTGIGIDPAVLPKLFQPFMQADASTTR